MGTMNFEECGKLWFAAGLSNAMRKDFIKAYEYFIKGLSFVTCNCNGSNWRREYDASDKTLFDDTEIPSDSKKEYYFVKAFVLSTYTDDKCVLQDAYDAIKNFYSSKELSLDFDYLLHTDLYYLLNENPSSNGYLYLEKYNMYISAVSIGLSPRLLLKIGLLKEYKFDKYQISGISEIFLSFLFNPSSTCCARYLQKSAKKNDIKLPINTPEPNILVLAFNNLKDEYDFQLFYTQILIRETFISNFDSEIYVNSLDIIIEFLMILKANSALFLSEEYKKHHQPTTVYGLNYKEFLTTCVFCSDDSEESVAKLSADILEEYKNKILDEKLNVEYVKSDNNDNLQIRDIEDYMEISDYRRKFKTDAKRISNYLEREYYEIDKYTEAIQNILILNTKDWLLEYFEVFKTTLNWPEGLPYINSMDLKKGTPIYDFNLAYSDKLKTVKYELDNDLQTIKIL
jgi:hypothetical protein